MPTPQTWVATLTLFFVNCTLWIPLSVQFCHNSISSVLQTSLYFCFNSTMLSWLISCTLNFSLCMANPVCITNECIMYTNYRYRLYTRYTFYCCSSRELFSFSQLEVRIFKICLIVWQMPHLFKSFWAQRYILLFLSAFHLSLISLPLPNHPHSPLVDPTTVTSLAGGSLLHTF